MARFLISSVILAAGLLTAQPAYSRGVVIDTNSDVSFTPCTYGAASCQAFSTTSAAGSRNAPPVAAGTSAINFALNYGNGQQSNVYVYNNGLISVGSQLSGAVNPVNSLPSLGADVLTPAYDPSLQALNFTYSTGLDGSGLFFNQQFLRLNYTVRANNNPATDTAVQVSFFQNGNPGDFVMFFAYGAGFSSTPSLPASTLIGFTLGSSQYLTTAGQNQAAIADTGDETTFRYTFVGGRPVGAGAVPEPATWLQLILGFGLLGLGLRRLRGSAAARPALG